MSTRRALADEALEKQGLLLVKMMTELFEEAEAAVTDGQHKAVSRKAWTCNSLGRAWSAEKKVVDAAFGPALPAKNGSGDGRGGQRRIDDLEEQIRRGTERLDELLGKPPRYRAESGAAGGAGAGDAGAGLAQTHRPCAAEGPARP